ncbi:MAG: ribosome biogenesis GTP-binding protein YihA/YsxC [Pseudomonadota bacterium]|nr:ribosome biogenesis GTP-binding protein YihA/YsxC [Pseudomonadota bacterium]
MTGIDLEAGRLLFAGSCDFVAGANSLDIMPPPDLPEVAFAGRSNVGKSSLINALAGRRALARISNTPGRTQQLNFFDLGKRLKLVDLPGYGFAAVSKSQVAAWTDLVLLYLKGRVVLNLVCLLIDGRHGLKDTDRDIMKLLDVAAVPYRIVLTKCDKVNSNELDARIADIETEIKTHPAARPALLTTSSRNGRGIQELRAELELLAKPAG